MKISVRKLLYFIALALVISSCKDSGKTIQPDEEFAAYISSFTQGMIPAEAPLTILLAFDPGLEEQAGEEIKENLFSFQPAVKGKAYRIDERSIRFIPDSGWPMDATISVSFFLNKLSRVPEKFHIFRFSLQTQPFSMDVGEPLLMTQSDFAPDLYKLNGTVYVSQKVDENELAEAFTLKAGSKAYKIKIEKGNNVLEYQYSADSIERTDKATKLELTWNARRLGGKQSDMHALTIHPKGDFRHIKTVVNQNPDQSVILYFTDLIDKDQSLDGLIQFQPEQQLQFNINKNSIEIFSPETFGGEYVMRIAASLRNPNQQQLANDIVENLSFRQLLPEVRFTGRSTILSSQGKNQITFQTIGLRAVDIQVVKIFNNNILQFLQWNNLSGGDDLHRVGRVVAREQLIFPAQKTSAFRQWQSWSADLNELIGKDEGAIYRIFITFKKNYAIAGCEDERSEIAIEASGISDEELRKWGNSYYYDPSYYYPDDFNWMERDNPCSNSYYYYDRFPARNFISSNLGLIAKQADLQTNEYSFYVNHLETTEPMNGVRVELFDFQQQSLGWGSTNAAGMVKIKTGRIAPFIAVASSGKQRMWLKLDESSALPLSRFDIDGKAYEKGMKGFLFNERGVYRPGDTLFIGFILRTSGDALPDNYPVNLELTNSRQQLDYRQTEQLTKDGMVLFRIPTTADAPTGLWMASVKAGNVSFERRIRVETVMPNRLKLQFNFGNTPLLPADRQKQVSLKVNWLHGAVAAGFSASLIQTMQPADVKFEAYGGFVFSDPSMYGSDASQSIIEGKTDNQGVWQFKLDLPQHRNIRSMIRLQWQARVTEPGGGFSSSVHTMDYLPFSHYLGIQLPKPNSRGYITTDQTHEIQIVRLNTKAEPTGNKQLRVQVYKLDWSWWWSGDAQSRAAFVSTYNAHLLKDEFVTLQNGKAIYRWRTDYPEWGNYFIRVSDPDGGHSTGQTIYMDWPDTYSRQGRKTEGGPSLLSLSTDKKSYKIGDKAIISFQSPGKGRVLVSVESGSKQLHSWWTETGQGETAITIPLSDIHSPNVFVHLSMLQPVGQLENDMPVRAYGIVNLTVENPASRLIPEIQSVAEASTGVPIEIGVKEQKGRPMTYLVAVVDEGLLDLTAFKTPDPHAFFYAKEALGLSTWDMYDYVLGAYGGRIEQVFAVGGDENIPDREKARQSRFTPVVRVLGPFTLKSGEQKKHSIAVNNYIGSVKTMVIAVSGRSFGSAEKQIAIRQPLMVLSTLPRLLRPDDEVAMPVTVFSTSKSKQSIEIEAVVKGEIALVGDSKQRITIDGEGEMVTYFRLKASKNSGKGSVTVKVSSSQNNASHTVELAIQNPNVRAFTTETHLVEPDASVTFKPNYPGMSASHQLQVEAATLPPVNLGSRLQQLLQYPYGCTEQITSQGFAQLYLDKTIQLSAQEKTRQHQSLLNAIRQVNSRQNADGSVAYWPGSPYVHDWTEVFAGHFMVLASRAGKSVPGLFVRQWTKNQRTKASQWKAIQSDEINTNDMVQAYRLYVMALAGEPQMSAMNRLREQKSISGQASGLLAAAYALAGQKDAARALALGKSWNADAHNQMAHTFGSSLREKALRVETLLLIDEAAMAFPLLKEISDALNGADWQSTQSTAWGLYVWQNYAIQYDNQGNAAFMVSHGKESMHQFAQSIFQLPIEGNPAQLQLRNTGTKPLYISTTASGIPAIDEFIQVESGIGLNVRYASTDGKTIQPTSIVQGSSFSMQVEVVNNTQQKVEFLALNQLIPAGWEIINTRLNEVIESAVTSDFTDIRDDRVVYFFDLEAGQKRAFSVDLVAAYEGRFLLPSLRCEAMYDRRINAVKGGRFIEIVRN